MTVEEQIRITEDKAKQRGLQCSHHVIAAQGEVIQAQYQILMQEVQRSRGH